MLLIRSSSSRYTSTLSISLSKHLIHRTQFLSSSTQLPHHQPQPINPDANFFFNLLKQRPPLSQLKQIHARILTQSLFSHPPLVSSLIICYLCFHQLNSAVILFDNYPSPPPPTFIWNLMIRAHSKMQNCVLPMKYLGRMLCFGRDSKVCPDDYTFTFVITSCSHHSSIIHGEMVHGMVVKSGFGSHLFVGNSLINLYCVFTKLDDAHKLFDEMPERDVFSWTSLLGGYTKHGDIDRASDVFDSMPARNDVSWAVMISGLVSNQRYIEALDYFFDLLRGNQADPNEAILVCALSACAHLGAFERGHWIHLYMERNNIPQTPNISTALIDMYAKCGSIDRAIQVFNAIPNRDVHNFTSMISGLSIHGLGNEVMRVFSQMLSEGVKPNDITILGVLNGCSHSGLVHQGTSIFNDMEKSWGIVPKIEHYGSYVDLLGRAGHLEKAYDVVKTMPIQPDAVIWRALLSACRTHRDVSLGERIVHHLRQLGSSGQILLSSLYAYMGKWESVIHTRNQMGCETRNTSELGCSWIELNGVTHEFRVDDQLHPQISDIRQKLNHVLQKAKLGGYVTSTSPVTFDLNDEDKEQAVSLHSEKLAVAFGLMSTNPGTVIRIVKNLRTCEDCHSALKVISGVFDREIIVRDRSRFHVFKQGSCSCHDYW